jgi:hypothetical protein
MFYQFYIRIKSAKPPRSGPYSSGLTDMSLTNKKHCIQGLSGSQTNCIEAFQALHEKKYVPET